MTVDEQVQRFFDVLRERTGTLEEDALLVNARPGDPSAIKPLLDRVRLSVVDQENGYWLFNVALDSTNARPGRILYHKKDRCLTARAPKPTTPAYRLIRDATAILYHDVTQKT